MSNLFNNSITINSFAVTWDPPNNSNDIIAYIIEIKKENDNFSVLKTTDETVSNINNLSPGSQYFIRVKSQNENGISESSGGDLETNGIKTLVDNPSI